MIDETVELIDLGYDPRPWQLEAHRALQRFSVLVVHRRGGKTVFGIATLIDAALRTQKANARYAYVAPYRIQAKAIAWSYLKQYATRIPGAVVNESELWVMLPNGSQIRLYGADNADALRGLYLDGVVMDEVADMRPTVWGEVVRPMLADRQGWALFIGTPKGVNLFSELYYAAVQDPSWCARLLTIDDTQAIAASEIAAMRTGPTAMGEAQFRQEFLCDFASGAVNALLSADLVDAACRRHLTPDQYQHAPVILGVDVARYGDDRTCIFRRQGLASFQPIVMRNADTMQIASAVIAQKLAHGADAIFVDGSGGYGAGVIDQLRRLNHTCTEVQFGGKADDNRYLNKRAEMWFALADWVKAGGALANLPEIRLDLCAPTYTYADASNRFKLESKDDMKARGLPSPDVGDAAALTFAYPVAPRGAVRVTIARGIDDNPYDAQPRERRATIARGGDDNPYG